MYSVALWYAFYCASARGVRSCLSVLNFMLRFGTFVV